MCRDEADWRDRGIDAGYAPPGCRRTPAHPLPGLLAGDAEHRQAGCRVHAEPQAVQLIQHWRHAWNQPRILRAQEDAKSAHHTNAQLPGVAAGQSVVQNRERVRVLHSHGEDFPFSRPKIRGQREVRGIPRGFHSRPIQILDRGQRHSPLTPGIQFSRHGRRDKDLAK
jgi:hypothetical protein